MSQYKKLSISLIAGLIFPWSCAPHSIWPLAYLSIILLLYALENVKGNLAFFHGFLYGLGALGYGAAWCAGVHEYTQINWVPVIVWGGTIIAYFALFYGFWIYIYKKFFHTSDSLNYLLAFPIIGVFFEYLRTLTFPWLNYGYSQIDGPMHNLAPIVGVYGLSFAILSISSALYLFSKKYTIPNSITILTIGLATLIANNLSFVEKTDKKYSVAICQSNVKPAEKTESYTHEKVWEIYSKMVNQHLDKDLIIWSEYSIINPLHRSQHFIEYLDDFGKEHDLAIISGIPKERLEFRNKISNSRKPNHSFNGLIVAGKGHGEYYKKRLVPFGEYVPFHKWLSPLLSKLGAPTYYTIPSNSRQLVHVKDLKIVPAICYEVSFAQMIRNPINQYDSHVIVNITEDYWFKNSWGIYQQLEITRMRALENGVYLLRGSGSGISAIIDYKGQVLSQAKPFTMDILTGDIYELKGHTPWSKMGQWPLFFIMSITLMFLKYSTFKRKIRAATSV